MKLFTKQRVILIVAAIVLVLFLLRPGASRLKSRIIYSMSAAVGRPVDIGAVHFQFLPRPGFDLDNLVVYDDPAFSGEPILRAGQVTAYLRVTSLFRGHIEIARLNLTDPSLNLVHKPGGGWNLGGLLERTAHAPTAPTAKAKSEPRPAFPYIEASEARINFKNGPEKKPYALTNADFSLWQESENTWGVRLKALPFRSDFNLTDIGQLQVSGTWQRADSLRNTPMKLNVEWTHAQLGQITKFVTGNDQGWRGTAQVDLTLTGTPENLQIVSTINVDDFRRYDITTGSALRLAATCSAQYNSPEHIFREVDCNAPVGQGWLALKGHVAVAGPRDYDFVLAAKNIPATSALALIERAKKNLPDDLLARGSLQGSFSLSRNDTVRNDISRDAAARSVRFKGQGEISDFGLASAATKAQIGPQTIAFSLTDAATNSPRKNPAHAKTVVAPPGPRIEFGPVILGSGRSASPSVQGWINRDGYSFFITGDADIAKTLRLAHLTGVPAPQSNAEGNAQLDIQLEGSWVRNQGQMPNVVPPQLTGTAKLKNVRVTPHGVGPIVITSAEVLLAADGVRVSHINAKAADSVWTGSLDLPRGCGTPADCDIHFDLKTGHLSLASAVEWSSPRPADRPWYRVLESSASAGPSFLSGLHATGHLAADQLDVQSLSASHVSASVTIDRGKLQVADIAASVLGGKHRGQWQGDFTAKQAVCGGSGSLSQIALSQVADADREQWMSGTANVSYELKGECPAGFWSSAEGKVQFAVRDGIVPHVTLTDEEQPLKVTTLKGDAVLHAGTFEVKDAKLDSSAGKFQLTGTASVARDIDFKLVPATVKSGGYTITGNLSQPNVKPVASEQARLKTEAPK